MVTKPVLIKNSISGLIQIGLNSLLLIITIPLLIKHLGTEYFGVYATINIISNLNNFINIGISASVLKYLAEQGKIQESNFDIIISIILVSLITVPIVLLLLLYNKFILFTVLNINQINYLNYRFLYFCIMISEI